MVAQVADQAHDVLGDEPPDGAARVDANDDASAGVEHEPRGLQIYGVGVDERAGGLGDRLGVGAAITVTPGAATSADLLTAPWLSAATIPPPAAATTMRNAPNSSEKSRRHS